MFVDMKLIDGNAIAESIIAELTAEVSQLSVKKPVVAFIRIGEDPASVSYVRKKEKTAERIGIGSRLYLLAEDVNKEELFAQIDALNNDPDVNGILIQAPLPKHIDETETFNRVLPSKDASALGTSGAPCPPSARSAARKSWTTGLCSRWASSGACSICQLAPRAPWAGGRCQTVWPWQPISLAFASGSQACTALA